MFYTKHPSPWGDKELTNTTVTTTNGCPFRVLLKQIMAYQFGHVSPPPN